MGTLIRNAKTTLILIAFVLGAYNTATAGRIIYVDADAAGANNGSSWQNAYNYIQDALADANSAAKPVEIRVAGGTYRPDEDTLHPIGTGDRQAMFQLLNGVNIKGGYAGLDQSDLPDGRNVDKYRSILSGDLNGNDSEWEYFEWQNIFDFTCDPNRSENSYTVVTGSSTDSTAVLNGFTITAGHSNNQDPCDTHIDGGGMVNFCGSPTVIDCAFYRNSARSDEGNYNPDGGGMFNSNSNPALRNCKFIENFVFGGNTSSHGGGMCNINSNPTLTNCLFKNNIAEGYDSEYYGGAIYNFQSSPTLTDCSFFDNWAHWGGAVCNGDTDSNTTIKRCTFTGNYANDNGGAILSAAGNVIDCTFTDNEAYTYGGGVLCGNLTLINCAFNRNKASAGGGVYVYFGYSATMKNCTFIANTAGDGGGLYNSGGWYEHPNNVTVITNCSFSGNSAYWGGGMYNGWNRNATVTNCVLSGNSARKGGGIYYCASDQTLRNCTFSGNLADNGNGLACDWCGADESSNIEAINCIFWDGGNEIFNGDISKIDIAYSDVQGNWPGEGNIETDPCFAAPGHWDPGGTPQDANDDFWVEGDYHLKSQAGRWDANERRWTKDEVTSLCIDAGDPASPIGLEPFPNGGIINMGAYGGTDEASKSYFGEPVCEIIVAGDINGDCKVNFTDFAIMALHWLEDHNP
jgi:predicted outer membrane repeat protein